MGDETQTPAGWTRADWARWFIEHDDIDEAARVLQPGDHLELGHSDYLGLAEALGRRGLGASCDGRVVRVQPRPEGAAQPGIEMLSGELANGSRKPPARQTPVSTPAVKKHA